MALVRLALIGLLAGAASGEQLPVGPGGEVAGAPLMRRQSSDALEQTERLVSVDAHAHAEVAGESPSPSPSPPTTYTASDCLKDGTAFDVKMVDCDLDNIDCNCCSGRTDTMKQVTGETCDYVKIIPQEADPGDKEIDHTLFATHASPSDAFAECKCAAAAQGKDFGPDETGWTGNLQINGHASAANTHEMCMSSNEPPGSIFCEYAPSGCFEYGGKVYFNTVYSRAASDGKMEWFNKTLPKNPTYANPYAKAICVKRNS